MEAVEAEFARNFSERGEVGASVSIWRHGQEIVSLHRGARTKEEVDTWNADTLVPVWSATKGPAALVFLLVLHEAELTLDAPVQRVWPEMRTGMTFAQMLSHQGGLAALDEKPSAFEHRAVARALALQSPWWEPGTAHGYHPRTFGFLLEECARRLTGGKGIGAVLRERITGPIDADFWIGLPVSEHHRVARIYPGRMKDSSGGEDAAFFEAFATAGSLTRRAFASPSGLHAVAEMNQRGAWTAALPAIGGVGSARGLGRIYALLAGGGIWNGRTLVPPVVMEQLTTRLVNGMDRVLLMPTAFSAGCMMDPAGADGGKLRKHFGRSEKAFGHPGAGGSHAFADPERGIAFAYVMNQMELGVMPNEKSLRMVAALDEAVGFDFA
ncbi:MAG TPA: serine hydrolase domain-containing protein [Verrucomicrobiales bacterium]|nr:serine hydrolase domain-containing protein [Verrucomicrobiales bacterium]